MKTTFVKKYINFSISEYNAIFVTDVLLHCVPNGYFISLNKVNFIPVCRTINNLI